MAVGAVTVVRSALEREQRALRPRLTFSMRREAALSCELSVLTLGGWGLLPPNGC